MLFVCMMIVTVALVIVAVIVMVMVMMIVVVAMVVVMTRLIMPNGEMLVVHRMALGQLVELRTLAILCPAGLLVYLLQSVAAVFPLYQPLGLVTAQYRILVHMWRKERVLRITTNHYRDL